MTTQHENREAATSIARPPSGPARLIKRAIDATEERQWIRWIAGGAIALTVIAVSLAIIANLRAGEGSTSSDLANYLGLAFVSFTACAVPIPGIAPVLYGLVIYMGYETNWLVVSIVGGMAMAMGEGVGYLLGSIGINLAAAASGDEEGEKAKATGVRGFVGGLAGRVDEWMDKRGFVTLILLAAIPNPIVAFANFSAGASGMPFAKFYVAVAIGKTIRSMVLAGIGVWLRSVV
jgi:membrane protein YqaA with SNARE-associated domain